MATIAMYDSTDVAFIPAFAPCILVYVAGEFVTDATAAARFPGIPLVTIDPTGTVPATFLDVEKGNPMPQDAARLVSQGQYRAVYCEQDGHGTPGYMRTDVLDAFKRVGEPAPPLFLSWPGWTPGPLPPGVVAIQYGFHGTYDVSIIDAAWAGIVQPPPLPSARKEDDMSVAITSDGRIVVERVSPAGHPLVFVQSAIGSQLYSVTDLTDSLSGQYPNLPLYVVQPG